MRPKLHASMLQARELNTGTGGRLRLLMTAVLVIEEAVEPLRALALAASATWEMRRWWRPGRRTRPT